MSMSRRRPSVVLAGFCTVLTAAVLAVPAGAVVHFEKESLSAYEGQLRHKQVHSDAFHPGTPTGHLHVSLNDGKHMTVAYAPAQQARLVAQAQAVGAHVQVAKAAAKTAPVKHKLRYIAAGILIVVILIVLAVLLIGRRRTIVEEAREAPGESSAS